MSARPDQPLSAFLDGVIRRARALAALQGLAAGLLLSAAVVIVAGVPGSRAAAVLVSLAVAAGLAVFGSLQVGRSRSRTAAAIERRAPECRNLLVTAVEIEDTDATPAYVRARVFEDAGRLAARLKPDVLFPARRTAIVCAAGLAVWSTSMALARDRPATDRAAPRPSSNEAAVVSRVDVEVIPPEYTGRPAQGHRDPSRIEALAGSRIRLRIAADAAAVTVETIAGSRAADAAGSRAFTSEVRADADGFIAVRPAAATGAAGARRLIGLSVTPDAPPRVRATVPGKDLMLASGRQTVKLVIEAEDDLGLASLALKYTKVAGAGESFTFTEGDLPVSLARASDRTWSARAEWRLDPLELQPGDMVIYRGVATDRRPGAPAAESDTFVIEIAAPGALASEGFAIDDRQDKYAISQQMVIVKTERLLARRSAMSAAAFREEALDIAAEQRQVRAEFVFMMGGELADAGVDPNMLHEEEEAHGEEDIAAGRLANQGRMDLIRAIRSMSRAAARLSEPDVAGALPVEKEALAFLQRAFTRSRYILRTLGERERLDLSRRLTGTLAALARPARPAAQAPANPRVSALRQVLAEVAALAAGGDVESAAAVARATALAQRLLEIDPASSALRSVASVLAAGSGNLPARLEQAALALGTAIRGDLSAAPSHTADPEAAALAGALADAVRRGGKQP